MKSEIYDVIIVGSGFGGSAAAYALTKAGYKTLLLEKGSWAKRDESDWNSREILINKRYKSDSPLFIKQFKNKDFKPDYPNETVGGMSVFYGGASLRMRETDFEKWPIDYLDLEPYYTKAEKLLEVYGEITKDPFDPYRSENCLLESIPLTEPAQRIYDAANKLEYKPFKIPIAINYKNQSRTICIQCHTCDGFPCKIEAKNDLTMTVLKRAQDFDLEIITGVIVTKIIEKNGEITSIECINRSSKERFQFSSKIVIISGGAIQSPAILLRSNLEKYQNHRFIGKYLMRHCNAVVCDLFPFKVNPDQVFHKQVCVSHFYEDLREKLDTAVGIIQDIHTAPPDAVKHFIHWGVKNAAASVTDYVQSLICIAEDDPNIENCVTLSNQLDNYGLEIIKITHQYSKNDFYRLKYLVNRAKNILQKSGGFFHYTFNIDTFSHAVGTTRFGNDPETSALDLNCQFFGIKNLFVLDGGFMPTSAGVNPSLTIFANSLRVSDYIISNFDK